MRVSRCSTVCALVLLLPARLSAQGPGAFDLGLGASHLFSNAASVRGTTGMALGLGYRIGLSGVWGVRAGVATMVGAESVAIPTCIPDGGGCFEETLVPGALHSGELEMVLAPRGAEWLRLGAGPGFVWAPGARGANRTSLALTGSVAVVVPVEWGARPMLRLQATELRDPIGVIRWAGRATLGVVL